MHEADRKLWLILPAGGAGRRCGGDCPKQYLEIRGKTVLEHTLERICRCREISGIVLGISPEDRYWPAIRYRNDRLIQVTDAGPQRRDTVLAALDYLFAAASPEDWVMVHDAARPCITPGDVRKLMTAMGNCRDGAVLAKPVADTLKQVDENGRILMTPDRSRYWRAMTPQLFSLGLLHQAMTRAAARGQVVTDESAAMELAGFRPAIVVGRSDNIKITWPGDLAMAEFLLTQQESQEIDLD